MTENKDAKPKMFGLLTNATAVTLVRNEELEEKPLITPLLDEMSRPKRDRDDYELGSIMLEQYVPEISGNGFFNNRRRVAFVSSRIEDLDKMSRTYGWQHGMQFIGRIAIEESLVPFYPEQKPKTNPNDNKEIGIQLGERFFPVYRRYKYYEDDTIRDAFINTPEDVKNWYASRNAIEAINVDSMMHQQEKKEKEEKRQEATTS